MGTPSYPFLSPRGVARAASSAALSSSSPPGAFFFFLSSLTSPLSSLAFFSASASTSLACFASSLAFFAAASASLAAFLASPPAPPAAAAAPAPDAVKDAGNTAASAAGTSQASPAAGQRASGASPSGANAPPLLVTHVRYHFTTLGIVSRALAPITRRRRPARDPATAMSARVRASPTRNLWDARWASSCARGRTSRALAASRSAADAVEVRAGDHLEASGSSVVTENSTHESICAAWAGEVCDGYSCAAALPVEAM
mmetsp:Transcript_29381/g.72721  ORF Transcript_29381/g.72721 Transcript_29381/m.72721 type:complete len:258 (+) Transcript_29381:1601-2374(+)